MCQAFTCVSGLSSQSFRTRQLAKLPVACNPNVVSNLTKRSPEFIRLVCVSRFCYIRVADETYFRSRLKAEGMEMGSSTRARTNRRYWLWLLAMCLMSRPLLADATWQYVPDSDVRPVAVSWDTSPTPPDDVSLHVSFRGDQQRYAQLRYGSENSRRITVVTDRLEDDTYLFYVDADRDRVITQHEQLRAEDRECICMLDAEVMMEDQPQQAARRVRLRVDRTGKRLSVATLGYVEGRVQWPGADQPTIDVRRVDGNANGLFSDARDRILVDLNHDQQWDPVQEQFANRPVLVIGKQRFAVRADRLGNHFSLTTIDGVGNLRLVTGHLPPDTTVQACEAMFFAEDGSAYALRDLDESLSVPVGRYTLGSVTLTIDTGEKAPWHFVFSRSGTIHEDDWRNVTVDMETVFEAVGTPRFELTLADEVDLRAGANLSVSPRLYTEDGLLINLCARGERMGSFDYHRTQTRCTIELRSPANETLGSTDTGFA